MNFDVYLFVIRRSMHKNSPTRAHVHVSDTGDALYTFSVEAVSTVISAVSVRSG